MNPQEMQSAQVPWAVKGERIGRFVGLDPQDRTVSKTAKTERRFSKLTECLAIGIFLAHRRSEVQRTIPRAAVVLDTFPMVPVFCCLPDQIRTDRRY